LTNKTSQKLIKVLIFEITDWQQYNPMKQPMKQKSGKKISLQKNHGY